MKCPECDGKSGHVSSGDGWDEWDECRCCNPDGDNDSGEVTPERLAEYRAEVAAEVARIEAEISTLCKKCGVEVWACECGAQWSTVQ